MKIRLIIIETIRWDIGIEFGIGKHAMLLMKSGKRQTAKDKELPNKESKE